MLGLRHTADGGAPIDGRALILADLDGVVYRGEAAIADAVTQLNAVSARARVGYLTNNASRTVATVAAQLQGYGLTVTVDEIITSPQAATRLLARAVAPGSRVLVVGGDGLTHELRAAGFEVVHRADEAPAAVVQGFAPNVGWKHLAEAAFALAERDTHEPLPWIATNTDWTIPLERGIAPGNGTLVSAVHTAVQRLPQFAGKPEPAIFETAFARFGTRNAIMIGDRLDTDIQGARTAGIAAVHVLTGVDRPKQLLAAGESLRPDYIVDSLAALTRPYPETVFDHRGDARVGGARVRIDGHQVRVLRRGDSALDLLRAGCAAIWSAERAIYALQVPAELYEDHWRP